jgi:hypothetical protein
MGSGAKTGARMASRGSPRHRHAAGQGHV